MKTLVGDVHDSPLASKRIPFNVTSTIFSGSASLNAIKGFLPPSSKLTFFNKLDAASLILIPVSTEQIPAILPISGCLTK